MAKRKKKKRRGRYVVGALCCAAIVGVAIGLNFDGLGFGDGWGFDLGGSGSNDSGYSSDDNDINGAGATDENGQDDNAPTQLVTVDGDTIFHNGTEISLAELNTIIVNNSNATWELRSERAIAAVQDDVRALLQDHGVRFTETTN